MAQVGDIGIDLGTSNVLIYMKGKGIVLRQPAVVALERESRRVLAVGDDAYRMLGRTPGNLVAMRPLQNGTIIDFDMANTMLQQFITQVIGRRYLSRPRAVIAVPSAVNDVEKRTILSAMVDAGVRKTQLIDKTVAAALGIGLPFDKPYGTMIVEMSAGCTDISVLSLGKVAVSACVPCGGDAFDDAIIRYLRKKHNLLIGEKTAEELKINIGCAVQRTDDVAMDVTGRNLISGLPKTQAISASEIREAIHEPVNELIESIQGVLERTPPQLASDIFDDGIIFSGGASALSGLCEAIYDVLHVPCGVADDPQTCVVTGCGRAVEDPTGLKDLLSDKRHLGR